MILTVVVFFFNNSLQKFDLNNCIFDIVEIKNIIRVCVYIYTTI